MKQDLEVIRKGRRTIKKTHCRLNRKTKGKLRKVRKGGTKKMNVKYKLGD